MHDMRQISCPMCGRRVTVSENSSVPCPSCGVPVSAVAAKPQVAPIPTDDDSATRVATIPPSELVPAEVAPSVVATATPVVEPPTPSSAPLPSASEVTDPRTQPVSTAEVQLAAFPPASPALAPMPAPEPEQPAAQQPETQAEQPVTQSYMPAMSPTPRPAPKRNLALLIVGVIIAVVILLGIIGAAVVFANRLGAHTDATPTAALAGTATVTVPGGFVQFTDDGNVYKLNYPSEWTKTATAGDLNLAVFSGTPVKIPGVFEVEYFKTKVDPKTVHDTFFTTLEKSGKVTNKQGPMTISLAGETWQSETADVGTGSAAQHVVSMAANHGQYTLLIAYLASTAAFDSADTQAFQPMLNSFQFVQ